MSASSDLRRERAKRKRLGTASLQMCSGCVVPHIFKNRVASAYTVKVIFNSPDF